MTFNISNELAEEVRFRTHNWKVVGSALTISLFKGSYTRYIVIRKINTHNFQFTNIYTMKVIHFFCLYTYIHLSAVWFGSRQKVVCGAIKNA